MNDMKLLQNMVDLGVEAERFIATNLGGAIAERLQQDHDRAMTDLLEADVLMIGTNGVLALQNKANMPLVVLRYLNDIIEEGRAAEQILWEKE